VARAPRRKAARKRAPRASLGEVVARLAALEARIAQLERRRARLGDGRAAADPPPPGVKRCPGCGLALRRRKGRCAECGIPLDG
jgi:hypothetical protein